MKKDWLYDINLGEDEIKEILSHPENKRFIWLSALLLARKNSPKEVFNEYLSQEDFFIHWYKIKKQMRKDSWNNPHIDYWWSSIIKPGND